MRRLGGGLGGVGNLAEGVDLPGEGTMRDGLAWDEEDSTARRDTLVELDEGPSTERAPSTQSSPKVESWLTAWEDCDPTHPGRRSRIDSDIVAVESAAPASAIRRSSDRHPKSTPLPLARELAQQGAHGLGTVEMDDEDMRATVRREVVSLPPSMPPPSVPSLRSLLPSQVVVDERLVGEVARLRRWLRFSLALGLMALLVSAALAVVLVSTPSGGPTLRLNAGFGALAAHLESEGLASGAIEASPVAPVEQGIRATSEQPDVRMIVDGVERGTLPVTLHDLEPGMHEVRFEGGEAFAVDQRRVMVSEGDVVDLGEIVLKRERIEVLVALQTPFASVALTPIGGLPEPLSGPWPKTIYLPAGKYTLTAAKRGKRPRMVMLDLSLDNPKREFVLRLR